MTINGKTNIKHLSEHSNPTPKPRPNHFCVETLGISLVLNITIDHPIDDKIKTSIIATFISGVIFKLNAVIQNTNKGITTTSNSFTMILINFFIC